MKRLPLLLPVLSGSAWLLTSLTPIHAAERIALVVGINAYPNLPETAQLIAPRADAADLAASLRAIGFTVMEPVLDGTRDTLVKAKNDFLAQAAGAEIAVFYFSGHGVQVGDEQFLMPSDAPRLRSYTALTDNAIALRQSVMVGLEEAGAKTKIVILDCCRDNPFEAQIAQALAQVGKSMRTKSVGEITGYGPGFFLAFATSPGQKADDGNGARNSPFTAALLTHLKDKSGLSVRDLLDEVKTTVRTKSGEAQVPWVNDSLDSTHLKVLARTVATPSGGKAPASMASALPTKSTPTIPTLPFTPSASSSADTPAGASHANSAQRGNTSSVRLGGLRVALPPQLPDLGRRAAEGVADAQFELGMRYLGGEGVPKDLEKAVEWLRRSAGQNNLAALNALGTLYEEGLGVAKDASSAFEYYQRAAKYGFPLAEHNLAECYDSGCGVEKNAKEALKWVERAAHQEFAPSQALYAWKLEKGSGTEKNTSTAAKWYLKASQNGLIRAMTHLAYMYYTGVGVQRDFKRAEAWYRRAAVSGDPWACNDLAWFLAVCPDRSFCNGEEAVRFARQAMETTSQEEYMIVDTMAAAIARTGDFQNAVQTATRAMSLLSKSQGYDDAERKMLLKQLEVRFACYKAQKPFVEILPSAESGTRHLMEDRILEESLASGRKTSP